jgi:uncharacterized protein (DUF2336 family)
MIVQRFLQWMATAPAEHRAEATRALVRAFLRGGLDEATREAAEAAMTVVLDDPSDTVRYALAEELAASEAAPRHLILALACDQERIAALVLSRSPLLIDAELAEIAATTDAALQVAVASRADLSATVSAALAEAGEREACRRLLANVGAKIARVSFRRLAERFGNDAGMRAAMLARSDLPADVRLVLSERLGAALSELAIERAWLASERARMAARDACERVTVAIAAETETEELPALAEHLRVSGQLTTALLLRAVAAGNIVFFAAALAILAQIPFERAGRLLAAGRRSALRAAYERAGLPAMAFEAFVAAIGAWREAEEEDGPADRYAFTRAVVEDMLVRYRDITDGEANELAAMLRRFAAEQTREAARNFARDLAAA